MYCNRCGQPIASGIQFCPSCGANVEGAPAAEPTAATTPTAPAATTAPSVPAAPSAPAPAYAPAAAAVPQAPGGAQYASFGIRFVAALIDGVINWVASMAIQIPMGIGIGLSDLSDDPAALAAMVGVMGISVLASLAFGWLYEALLTSSTWQATVGKKAVGIIVVDEKGDRISFLRATGRHFGKIISGIVLMAGYLIQPFTPKRQALHDIMAGTLVVKR